MVNEKEKIVWRAIGRSAIRFINGYPGIEDTCRTQQEAIIAARLHNEEEENYG